MHKLAVIADAGAEASQVTWVVAEVVTEVAIVGVSAVVVHWVACGVAVRDVETVGRGLELWLCDYIHIVDSYA